MLTLSPTDSISAVAGTNNVIAYTFFGDGLVAGVDAFKVLNQGLISSSPGVIFPATAGQQSLIRELYLANSTGIPVTSIKLFVNGIGATNQMTGTFTIVANGTATLTDDGLRVYDGTGALVGSSALTSAKNYAARTYARQNWR